MKLKSNNVLTLFIICFYMFSLGSFGIRARWIVALTLVSTVVSAFCSSSKIIYISKLKKYWCIMLCAILSFISMPFARHDVDVYNMAIFVIITSIAYLVIRTDEFEIEKVFSLIIYTSLFFAIYISFFRVFPGMYNATVYKLLSEQVKITYNSGLRDGYGIPIGNGYTLANNIIQLGICATGAKDLAEGESCIKNKIYILIMVLGILLEGRKSELICALATILFMYYVGANRFIKAFRNRIFFISLATCAFIFTLNIFNNKNLLARFLVMFERLKNLQSDPTVDFTSGRFTLWKIAITMFKDNPFLGVGWGGFGNHGGELVHLKNVHNCLLQLMCETGLIGTVIICFPMAMITKTLFRLGNCRKKRKISFFEKRNHIFCASVLFYLIILSFLDPNFYGPYFWYMLAIIVPISEYTTRFSASSLGILANITNNKHDSRPIIKSME